MFQFEKKENTSQYKGVTWHIQCKKWYVQISVKGEKIKYGGLFNDELHAAKKVNQLCENFGMSPQNPGIGQMSTQEPPVTREVDVFTYRMALSSKHLTLHTIWFINLVIKLKKGLY
jgi:hypothetical protein